ncbi:MAG: flagellar filament capping protein FliD [Treponema sp.]|nr:flagellar filament capping protein FliD [Treponema sp.]MCL2236827.1 flagellar filament capping protein FliD [Treponema sp.]
MSDVYIPGVRSRFNSEQTVENLMNLERVPRDRVQQQVDTLQVQRGYWQEVGRRINTLRDSARALFSFQNPFNERIGRSADENVITATATREAAEQQMRFAVKQVASADRFLSQPLDERTRIEPGTYTFTVGNDEISIAFRGGTLNNFVELINRRGRDKVAASLIAVQPGTRSLLIESKLTGSANRLGFSGDAAELVTRLGMMETSNDTQRNISINESSVRRTENAQNVSVNEGVLKVAPRAAASLPVNIQITDNSPLVLRLETQTRVEGEGSTVTQTPPGPTVPAGSVTYSGITIQNQPSSAPSQDLAPPAPPVRNDNMNVLHLVFSDGTTARLPAITDSSSFTARQYNLTDVARGKTIVSLDLRNENTHREVSIGKVEVLDPTSTTGGLRPLNAVATARDAIISMEGIDIVRSSNNIDDLIPGVTLNVRGVSERPVELRIVANVEAIKDSIISFVGNYNLLMAEINVLTRRDDRVIDEITYITAEERTAMRERLGVFASDASLTTFRNNLQRTVTAPYPTSMERDLALLAQIGISTNSNRSSGYDPSRLRGYLQINEPELDAALENKVPAIRELFASDTTGDLLADTGVAFNVDALMRPFVETGGIISLKTSTIDSRISRDERRIANLDRQLAAREQELRIQYARMEAAYARMEQMSTSLDNFNNQNRGNR